MGFQFQITVFTPTYNRAYIIENLYRSLQRQTFTDFEWVVVDDGSTDNTKDLFTQWIKDKNAFSIRYIQQPNGGKCRAINHALDLSKGRLFFTVDSDDYLTDDALCKIIQWEAQLPKQGRFCGVAGNLGTSLTETSNSLLKSEYYEGTLLERYSIIDGERAFAFYTDVHKQYRYPEIDGEKFMTEAVTWNRMAHDGYLMRFYNDIVCIFEYKNDGLTKAGSNLFINNPRGYGLFLREKAEYMHDSWLKMQKMIYTFTCDLSDKKNHELIAEYIGTSTWKVKLFYCIHMISQRIRKRK